MEAEIVFTGLCSVLNPDGKKTKTMGDPAVILVQTQDHSASNGDRRSQKHGGASAKHTGHIAYLAFDPAKVDVQGVDIGTLPKVPQSKGFVYLLLDGVELQVKDQCLHAVTVDQMYREYVAHRDDYWPQMKGKFDRDLVPLQGSRPKKEAVKVWMRFCGGRISASRISKAPWEFHVQTQDKTTGKRKTSTLQQCFAEEIVYDGFPHGADALVIARKDLETGGDKGDLRFSTRNLGETLTLIIGNHMKKDMGAAERREITTFVQEPNADHFKFLNRTAGKLKGPTPKVKNPPPPEHPVGGSGGACGPGSGNGHP
jgi:hypothetical protein